MRVELIRRGGKGPGGEPAQACTCRRMTLGGWCEWLFLTTSLSFQMNLIFGLS